MKPLRITCQPDDLDQGLFGNVFYHVFQVLPYLYERGLYPAWQIRAKHYGDPPDFIVLPGALDLAYTPPVGPYEELSLSELRRRHAQVLGNDWSALNRIWNAFFKTPDRVLQKAESLSPKGRVLGIHYRGTDKQKSSWDSNPISQAQFIALIQDFLEHRNAFDAIVAASDEHSFADHLASAIPLPVTSLGEVEFHLAEIPSGTRADKSDRAMLDCILLSRCLCVIETSSGLPSFAKLFNPDLEIYRCAASRLFNDMPYFPVAYIPVLPVTHPASTEILNATMIMDWALSPDMKQYRQQFVARPRWPFNHRLFAAADRLGASTFLAKFVNGYH